MVRPSQRREKQTVEDKAVSIWLACTIFAISETCYRYRPKLSAGNSKIADWLIRLTHNQRNWGFGLCFLYLRNVKGFGWNHKRVYRIYRELELNLRIEPRKRLGKPQQNAYIERYNRTVRYDLLAQYLFDSIEEVQENATHWLWTYNNERPNMALGGITPRQKLELAA